MLCIMFCSARKSTLYFVAWWEFAVLRVPIQHPFTVRGHISGMPQDKLNFTFCLWSIGTSHPYKNLHPPLMFLGRQSYFLPLKISVIQGKDCKMFEMNSVNTIYYNCHNLIIYLPNNFKIIIKCPWVKKMDLSVWKPGLHPLLKKFYNILQAKKQDLSYMIYM